MLLLSHESWVSCKCSFCTAARAYARGKWMPFSHHIYSLMCRLCPYQCMRILEYINVQTYVHLINFISIQFCTIISVTYYLGPSGLDFYGQRNRRTFNKNVIPKISISLSTSTYLNIIAHILFPLPALDSSSFLPRELNDCKTASSSLYSFSQQLLSNPTKYDCMIWELKMFHNPKPKNLCQLNAAATMHWTFSQLRSKRPHESTNLECSQFCGLAGFRFLLSNLPPASGKDGRTPTASFAASPLVGQAKCETRTARAYKDLGENVFHVEVRET